MSVTISSEFSTNSIALSSIIQILQKDHVLDPSLRIGAAALIRPTTFNHYQKWLADGCYGEMKYLKKHLFLKENPQEFFPHAQTALVFTIPYWPHPYFKNIFPLNVALYAMGSDYHYWFKNKLKKIQEALQIHFPKATFKCFSDSGPLLERELAARANLGWIGRNTCLIHPNQGSFFFIGEILTTLNIQSPNDTAIPNRCGHCRRCIESCPTAALTDYRLDATRCLSYWTIEAKKSEPPPEIKEQLNSCFFGCDICQIVCPWNQKTLKKHPVPVPIPSEQIEALQQLLQLSERHLTRLILRTPLARRGSKGLKRNAMFLLAQMKT